MQLLQGSKWPISRGRPVATDAPDWAAAAAWDARAARVCAIAALVAELEKPGDGRFYLTFASATVIPVISTHPGTSPRSGLRGVTVRAAVR